MSHFALLVGKELRVEWRRRELVAGALVLAFLVLMVGNLAWGGVAPSEIVGPGVLWVAFVFASTIAMGRSVQAEKDRGTWDALAVLPVGWGTLFFSKAAANLVVLIVVEAATVVGFSVLFGHDVREGSLMLAAVLVTGSVGLVAAGTLLAGIAAHGRNREILLPILLVPLLFPLLMMAIQATQKVMLGLGWQAILPELQVLVAFDAIFLAVGWLTFDYVVGD